MSGNYPRNYTITTMNACTLPASLDCYTNEKVQWQREQCEWSLLRPLTAASLDCYTWESSVAEWAVWVTPIAATDWLRHCHWLHEALSHCVTVIDWDWANDIAKHQWTMIAHHCQLSSIEWRCRFTQYDTSVLQLQLMSTLVISTITPPCPNDLIILVHNV